MFYKRNKLNKINPKNADVTLETFMTKYGITQSDSSPNFNFTSDLLLWVEYISSLEVRRPLNHESNCWVTLCYKKDSIIRVLVSFSPKYESAFSGVAE